MKLTLGIIVAYFALYAIVAFAALAEHKAPPRPRPIVLTESKCA